MFALVLASAGDLSIKAARLMADGIGTPAYSYHAVTNIQSGAGQLASVDGPLANDTVSYEYDELGRVKRRAIDGWGKR